MGCNCKSVRKLSEINKRDDSSLLSDIIVFCISFINRLIAVLIGIIMLPLILVFALCLYLFTGDIVFKVPKILQNEAKKWKEDIE